MGFFRMINCGISCGLKCVRYKYVDEIMRGLYLNTIVWPADRR